MQDTFRRSGAAPSAQSPLRRLRGNLAEYKAETTEFYRDDGSKRQSMSISFNFKDVEVLEATEPYPFPIATIAVPYAPPATSRGGNRWEALAKSLRTLMPGDDNALDKLVGQTQEWAQLPASIRVRNDETQQWENAMADAWQVVSVDGVAQPEDLTDYISALAEGKTEQQWHQTLMTDQRVISRPDIVTSITERKLLDALLLANKISRDAESILHRA